LIANLMDFFPWVVRSAGQPWFSVALPVYVVYIFGLPISVVWGGWQPRRKADASARDAVVAQEAAR
jgi:hypothetical protein